MVATHNQAPAVPLVMHPAHEVASIGRTPDRRDHERRRQLLARVRAEFEEMPGLRLTRPQAKRLFGLRDDICLRVLASLTRDGVLWEDGDGRYVARGVPR